LTLCAGLAGDASGWLRCCDWTLCACRWKNHKRNFVLEKTSSPLLWMYVCVR
jgi:hypothetical protein